MESVFDVEFSLNSVIVHSIEGLPGIAGAFEAINAEGLTFDTAIIYGYDYKGVRYIVHKTEKQINTGRLSH